MTALQYVLSIVIIIVSVLIIALVMLQESKQRGLSGTIAGAGDTFFGKNKGRTDEAKKAFLTKILVAVFAVIVLASVLVMIFA